MRRPSPATGIALVALFFSLTGTAYAATGGNFILGNANSAKAVTSLTNKNGTALSLSSGASQPPLAVSNSVQVPNLNASELDGKSSSAFLTVGGTAANSTKLGGTPASGYMQGAGSAAGARMSGTVGHGGTILSSPGATLSGSCDPDGPASGVQLFIATNSGTNAGATATWWNKDGVASDTQFDEAVTPATGTPYMVTVQVDNVNSVSTFFASERYNTSTDTCSFTAQVMTTNG
jgi:FlaG/FlaF family flagellin (archaellin)